MSHTLQARARDVFLEVCELSVAEREAKAADLCGNDAELLREVLSLAAELEESGPFDAPAARCLVVESDVFEPGATVAGRFEVVRRLGRGGMGEVYEAYDPKLKERVALKTLRLDWLGHAAARHRFLREIRLARSVEHPNVCRIYDHAEHAIEGEAVDLVSMRLLEGRTLGDFIHEERPSPETALQLARDLAAALDAAHEAGVVHLDFKPSNVIVVEQSGKPPKPVIMDFGIARSLGGETATVTGEVRTIGTPQYMAPEQLRGERPGRAADVYALGVVLCELATGTRAFAGRTLSEALDERGARTAGVVADLRKQAGGRWAAAVERCLALDAEDRPEKASDAIRMIEGTLSPKRESTSEWWKRAALAAVVILLAAGAALWANPDWARSLWYELERPFGAPLPNEMRLAVLPFELAAEEGPTREFADGLAAAVVERTALLDQPGGALVVIPAEESLEVAETDAAKAAGMLGANLVVRTEIVRRHGLLHADLSLTNTDVEAAVARNWIEIADARPIGAREAIASAVAKMVGMELPSVEAPTEEQSKAYLHYLPARGYLIRENDKESVEKAISEFRRALAEDSGAGPAYAGLAQAYWRRYEIAKDPRDATLAIQAADNAIAYAPDAAESHIAAGVVRMGTGRHEEALADFHRALELSPDHADALIGLGRAYEKNGDMEAAEATLQRAIDLRPNLWLGYKWMGLFHYNAGRYEEAIEQYERILELAPNSVHAHLNLGTFHVLSSQDDYARRYWDRANELEPRATILGNIAALEFLRERYDSAIDYGERALAMDSTPHRLWSSLAASYHQAGRTDDARRAYQVAIERVRAELAVNSENASNLSMLGHYYAAVDQAGQAQRLTQEALALAPDDPLVLINAAETFAQLDQFDRAGALALRAIDKGYLPEQVLKSPSLRTLLSQGEWRARLTGR